MDTLGPRPAGDADPAPDAPMRVTGLAPDGQGGAAEPDRSGVDGAKVAPDRPDDKDDSDVPWAGIGLAVLVLVTGAFATGWHFGRRWGRLMGW